MMNLFFFEVTADERAYLTKSPLAKYKLTLYEKPIQEVERSLLKKADIVSLFIYSQLKRELLEKMPQLKFVATRSTDYDHIDLDACTRKKIPVSNVPFYGENTVAEHTFALILALSRRVHEASLRTIRGNFSFEGLQGFDLKGKTIGIIGTGHIGLHAVRIAKGFGMNALAYDVVKNTFMSETLGFEYVSLDTLLAKSDIISLHTPDTKQTHHLINRKNICRIKRGAILINTARGGLVETEALTRALDEGILSGAGLDVLEGEGLMKEERQILSHEFSTRHLKMFAENHILLNRDNVVITPHIAFNSKEAFVRILDTTTANIQAFMRNAPENLVKNIGDPMPGSTHKKKKGHRKNKEAERMRADEARRHAESGKGHRSPRGAPHIGHTATPPLAGRKS